MKALDRTFEGMKTTLDLPADLLDAVKHRARREGRRVADMAVDLMRRGLADEVSVVPGKKTRLTIAANGVPVVRCVANAPATQMSAEALIDFEQETLSMEEMQRLGLVL